MPQAAQRRDVVLQNGPSAAATLRCKHVKVVLPAVRLPVLFMEALTPRREQRFSSVYTTFTTNSTRSSSNNKIPSGPKKDPHWAQKKCSGCHVRSSAVTTFWEDTTTFIKTGSQTIPSCISRDPHWDQISVVRKSLKILKFWVVESEETF